eukprot:scaffold75251_cov34-Prasinocladus_malaysianus.AAC.1
MNHLGRGPPMWRVARKPTGLRFMVLCTHCVRRYGLIPVKCRHVDSAAARAYECTVISSCGTRATNVGSMTTSFDRMMTADDGLSERGMSQVGVGSL